MKLIALFAATGCSLPLCAADKPLRVRVLCYNIHHGEGVDGKLNLARIARVIQSVKPDVVALQEVDRKTKRTGHVDQPAELARLTKMNVIFGKNLTLQGGGYGNAILSRFKIGKHSNTLLPRINNGEQRGVLKCELKLKGETIAFLCTHLDHRRDDRERVASARKINQIATSLKHPAILAGDLNATRKSAVLKSLQKQWAFANAGELPTIPVSRPTRQIDFVLSRSKRWKTIEARVLDEKVASDHRAIFVVLELRSLHPPNGTGE